MKTGAQQKFPTLVASNEDTALSDAAGSTRVGDLLRSKRLSRDEDLTDVAAALRIRLPYLQAIEDGNLSQLPGATYAIGFVRAYAEYLNLDASETVDRFKAESAALEERTELVFPEPLPGSRVPGGALIFLALILAGLSYGGWLYLSSQDRPIADLVPALPDSLAALLDGDRDTTKPPQADAVSTSATATTTPAPKDEASPDTETVAATAASETSAESPAPAAPAPADSQTAQTESEADTSAIDGTADGAVAEATETVETALENAPPAAPVDTATVETTDAASATQQEQEPQSAATSEPAAEVSSEVIQETAAAVEVVETTQATTGEVVATAVAASEELADAAVEEVDAGSIAGEVQETVETLPAQPELEPEPVVATPEPSVGLQTGGVSDNITAASPEPDEAQSDTQNISPSAEAVEPEPVTPEPETTVAVTESAPETPTVAIAASLPAVPDVDGVVYGGENPDARVILKARVATWIEVRDSEQAIVFTRLMRPGDVYRVPNRTGLTMVTGNAGGLSVEVDGSSAPALGSLGDVLRDISLDPDKLDG